MPKMTGHVFQAGIPPAPFPVFKPDTYQLLNATGAPTVGASPFGTATPLGPATVKLGPQPLAIKEAFSTFLVPFPSNVVPFFVAGPSTTPTPFCAWGPKGGNLSNTAKYSTDQVLFQYSYNPATPPQLKGSAHTIPFNPAAPLHIHCEMAGSFSSDPTQAAKQMAAHLKVLSNNVSGLFTNLAVVFNPLNKGQFTQPNLNADKATATKLGLDPTLCGPLSWDGKQNPPYSACGPSMIVG